MAAVGLFQTRRRSLVLLGAATSALKGTDEMVVGRSLYFSATAFDRISLHIAWDTVLRI